MDLLRKWDELVFHDRKTLNLSTWITYQGSNWDVVFITVYYCFITSKWRRIRLILYNWILFIPIIGRLVEMTMLLLSRKKLRRIMRNG